MDEYKFQCELLTQLARIADSLDSLNPYLEDVACKLEYLAQQTDELGVEIYKKRMKD